MNPYSGHLVSVSEVRPLCADYFPVPLRLERAANRKLAGRDEAYVSLTSGGKLSRFAAELRRKANQKETNRNRNKTASAARRRNRA